MGIPIDGLVIASSPTGMDSSDHGSDDSSPSLPYRDKVTSRCFSNVSAARIDSAAGRRA